MHADQLSQSAAFIAIKFYGLTREERFRRLFEPFIIDYYERIVRSLPPPLHYYHYWLEYRPVRSFLISAEELLLPGDLMHILIRKWYIDHIVEDLVSSGYEQILILGAGFDHLGLRQARQGIPSLELDAPRMARLKKRLLAEHYPGVPHPEILPLTLPDHSLSHIIKEQQRLSRDKKTVIISEGFFDYLGKKAVEGLLSTLRNTFASPALVSTHFALDELSSFHRFIFRTSLRIVRENPEFGATMETFRELLRNTGFHLQKEYSRRDFHQGFMSFVNSDLQALKGFYLLSAQ